MTRQKTFKRKVRARMQKTGESYTAARRRLIAEGERPEAGAAEFEPPMSDDAIRERTGRGWDEWFTLLDAWEVALEHARLPDADTAEEMESWWCERVGALKEMLEGG